MDIPQIPGLAQHPVQVAEQQRLAEIRRRNPAAAPAQTKSVSIMPDATRAILKRVAQAMRSANAAAGEAPAGEPQQQQSPAADPARRVERATLRDLRSQLRELP
jgi:penicillin-binding protein 1A